MDSLVDHLEKCIVGREFSHTDSCVTYVRKLGVDKFMPDPVRKILSGDLQDMAYYVSKPIKGRYIVRCISQVDHFEIGRKIGVLWAVAVGSPPKSDSYPLRIHLDDSSCGDSLIKLMDSSLVGKRFACKAREGIMVYTVDQVTRFDNFKDEDNALVMVVDVETEKGLERTALALDEHLYDGSSTSRLINQADNPSQTRLQGRFYRFLDKG